MKKSKYKELEKEIRAIVLPLQHIIKICMSDTKSIQLDSLNDMVKSHNGLLKIRELLEEEEDVKTKFREQKLFP